MKQIIVCLSIIMATALNSDAQKVAIFSCGTYGQTDYEEFSFWVKANKRADITYRYRKDNKENKVGYVSTDVLNGENVSP